MDIMQHFWEQILSWMVLAGDERLFIIFFNISIQLAKYVPIILIVYNSYSY